MTRPRWEILWVAPPSNPWARVCFLVREKLSWWWVRYIRYSPMFLRSKPEPVRYVRDLVKDPLSPEELEAVTAIRRILYRRAQERN